MRVKVKVRVLKGFTVKVRIELGFTRVRDGNRDKLIYILSYDNM